MFRLFCYSFAAICVLSVLSACHSNPEGGETIGPMKNAWKRTDNMQIIAAAEFTDYQKHHQDTAKILHTIDLLNKTIDIQTDSRLKVRSILYQVLWTHHLLLLPRKANKLKIEEAIKLAYPLNDACLMAELYAAYAEISDQDANELMFYSLKSAELQEKIGLRYTKPIHQAFYYISATAHYSQDYRLSIRYGLKSIEIWKNDSSMAGKNDLVHAIDLVGASYKQLGNYDSSLFFNRKMDTAIQLGFTKDSSLLELYKAICIGNRGELLGLQGHYEQGLPLLQEYRRVSEKLNYPLNIAQSSNAIGKIYMMKKNADTALQYYRNAFALYKLHGRIEIQMIAADGLAEACKALGETDSAFYYFKRAVAYRDELHQQYTQSLYAKAKLQLEFENAQHNLRITESTLLNLKKSRNVVVFSALLIFIILLLLYNRQRLKQKIKSEIESKKHEQAIVEVEAAKKSIEQFVSSVREKNDIIASLENRLRQHGRQDEQIPENLLKYSLVSEEGWISFKEAFKTAYPLFLLHFQQKLGHVTTGEERLSTLIYLKFDNYQIANTLGISKDSVARSKRRLAKRLGLPINQPLNDFIMALG